MTQSAVIPSSKYGDLLAHGLTIGHEILTVLVVDDQDSSRVAVSAMLDRHGFRVLEAHSAEWALEQFLNHRPDAVFLDIEMPGFDGYWVAERMRELEPDGWTPIIYLSAHGSDKNLYRGIEAGGDDFLAKPVSEVVLLAKLHAMDRLLSMRRRLVEVSEELREANQRLAGQAIQDGLTGLMNRRGLDARLGEEINNARRTQTPLSVFLCDVDHFKQYNDTLGHGAGDECLKAVASELRALCRRPSDVVARYGGEEFALLLPDTPRSGALTLARTLLHLMNQRALPHPKSSVGPLVSLSGGICTLVPGENCTPEDMLLRADEALYVAKSRGRNRFFSFELRSEVTL